jgi:hypothetical protein
MTLRELAAHVATSVATSQNPDEAVFWWLSGQADHDHHEDMTPAEWRDLVEGWEPKFHEEVKEMIDDFEA